MLLFGIVKFFDATKKYGFITPNEGGPDVYFRLGDRKEVKLKDETVILGDSPPKGTKLADPKQGSDVVYKVAVGKKGPRAKGWAHLAPYQVAQGELDKLPELRVVKVVTLSEGSEPQSEAVWYGKVPSVAKREFPQLGKGPVKEQMLTATITAEYRLEQKVDDNWTNEVPVVTDTRPKPKRSRAKKKAKTTRPQVAA